MIVIDAMGFGPVAETDILMSAFPLNTSPLAREVIATVGSVLGGGVVGEGPLGVDTGGGGVVVGVGVGIGVLVVGHLEKPNPAAM
jgi:hypothetical protein